MKYLILFLSLWLVPAAMAQDAQTVTVTANNHVYFVGGDSQREKVFTANLPTNIESFNKVILHFKLSCPSGRCDPWDRVGSLAIKTEGKSVPYIELLRFITPYGIGGQWSLDVTDFWPLLQGEQTFKLFIDTWVGPGSVYGNGWLVDATLEYQPGVRSETTAFIEPVLSFSSVVYGNPLVPTERKAAVLPLIGFTSAKLLTVITGHGQGNLENCGEFCPKVHTIKIGSQSFSKTIWRADCATTVDPTQKGTWYYPRAGWCPGDIVAPWTETITGALTAIDPVYTYDIEAYENTCRPDSAVCKGCLFGGCNFDGGAHTEPSYNVSSYILYKK